MMLNKSLLIPAPGNADYTHIVLVYTAIRNDYNPTPSYGFNNNGRNDSTITPATLKNYSDDLVISELSSYTDLLDNSTTTLNVNGFLADYQILCLGRADTKLYLGNPSSGGEESGECTWADKLLFDSVDYAKAIPIWLANTRNSYP